MLIEVGLATYLYEKQNKDTLSTSLLKLNINVYKIIAKDRLLAKLGRVPLLRPRKFF